ncbi:MAG: hypothetical protein V4654_01855 [Bdellovibrionota bacterium]
MKFLIGLFFFFPKIVFGNDIIQPFGYETLYQQGSFLSKFDGTTLTSVFPKNIYGSKTSGFSFGTQLNPKVSRTISYEVKFEKSFDFVRGGKLPGLCGGKNASGGIPANGTNGFSARMMWRKNGRLVSYVYHVNQKSKYGDDFQWITSAKKDIQLTPGAWHKIKFTVSVNDLGQSNGAIKGYFDGVLAFEKHDLLFRTTDIIAVDQLCFNTFFGGNDTTWAPSKEERLYIRNLQIN